MWMWNFPPGLLHCFVLFCLGLQGLPRQMVMTDVWSWAWCVRPTLESWQSLRGLDSSGWVPWANGPCVTWLTAYLSLLLHRPPSVSVCFSVRRRLLGPKSYTVLVPVTRSSVSFLIAFHLYISRLDNRMPMSDCKSGSTVINAWRLAPTTFLIIEGWDHHGVLYVDLSPKGTLEDSQDFLCWNK